MQLSRRRLAALAAGLLAGPIGSAAPALAQAGDAEAVGAATEALRKAMAEADAAKLGELLADGLVYVHSSGKVESKADVVAVIGGKKTIYKSLAVTDQTVSLAGANAIVRHVFVGEAEVDGKVTPFKVGAMQVWSKADGKWRLLARQAFKLA